MKNINKWLVAACGALVLTSCADVLDTNNYVVTRPGNAEQYEYLREYQPLKEYLDRSAHPNFKVSAALTASEFNKKDMFYALAVGNFDEIVAGNAMKMASVVSDKGDMDFGTVNEFVTTAEEAGLTIYGHTLAWHAQQPVKWLNSLIADKPKPVDPNEKTEKEVVDYTLNFGDVTNLSWNGCPEGEVVIEYGKDDCLVLSNAALIDPWYAFQYWVVNGINLVEGQEYTIKLNCRYEGAENAAINVKIGDWGGGLEKSNLEIAANGDFKDYKITGAATMASNGIFIQHANGFLGTLYLNSITISHMEVSGPSNVEYKEVWTNQLVNSDMEAGQSMDCFVVRDATSSEDHPGVAVAGGPDGKNCVVLKGKTETTNQWDTQFFIYSPNKVWSAGEKYRLHMWYKASEAIGTDSQCHGAPGAYMHWQMLNPNPSFTTEWVEKTWEGTIPGEGAGMQSIAFNLNKNHTADTDTPQTVGAVDYYFAGITWESCELVEVPKTEEQYIKKRCIIVETDDMQEHEWDSQFWIQTNEPFHAGDKYEFSAEVRADYDAAPGTQIHQGSAGGYIHWSAIGNTTFTTEWSTISATGSIPAEGDGGDFIAWNLNDFNPGNKYYFGNISFKINGVEQLKNGDLSGDDISSFWKKEKRGATINAPIVDGYTIVTEVKSTIPLTEEEKRDTLTYAMKLWMDGMMEATEGKVKAWDLVNEAISGGGNVEGYYDLQHATEDNTTDFFWQDYLGNVGYVVTAEKLAREAYAKVEGTNPADLKLFINDYNLESTWDNNKKLESLIYWIGKWEEAGAKIDGIGTQMHISYILDPEQQKAQEDHIVNMLKLMAGTGKLVRISELDMGVCEKQFGTALTTEQITFEIEQKMAAYYQWIIEKYFEIVPANQQYGICQWCLTDAPANSGWRKGEPVGLWTLDYQRKPAYAGWAEGLKK